MAAKGSSGKANDASGNGRKPAASLDSEIDALFQLPLGEFTAARNALAARLKKAGRPDEAEQVKGLAKPSVTAWVVNQLYWRHRAEFDRLMDTGEQFRRAQAAQLAGKSAELRGPLEGRRAALADLSRLAAAVLREGGSTATPENMRRITTTLEALSTYGSLADAPRAGRLQDDVEPPGFETLAALVPRVDEGGQRPSGPTHVIPFQKQRSKKRGRLSPEEEAEQRAAERKARKAALQEAERTLREARKAAQRAEERLKKAAARAKEAENEKAAAEQRLEKAAAAAEAARQEARRVAAEAEEAAQVLQEAERAVERLTAESASDD